MNKKELQKLPCTAPDWMLKKAAKYQKKTFLLRRKFGDITTYEIYYTRELKAGNTIPDFIVFKEKHDWINYSPKDGRWTKAKFENTTIVEEDEYGRVHYSAWYIPQYRILRNLRQWQNKIGEKRYRERIRKKNERIQNIMSLVPELPEDFMDFVENDLMKDANYIIYNRKENQAYCTRCQGRYTVDKLEGRNGTKAQHMKEFQFCPACNTWLKQLSSGVSRNGKGFKRGCEIMQPYSSGAIVREFTVYRDFEHDFVGTAGEKMITKVRELHRFIAIPGSLRKYETINGADWSDRTNNNFLTYGCADGKNYNKEFGWLDNTELGWEGFGEIMQMIVEKQIYKEGMERPLRKLVEKPYVEQMDKGDLRELAIKELQDGYCDYRIKEDETALVKILCINKEQLRVLRRQKNKGEALNVIQTLNGLGVSVNEEALELLAKMAPGTTQLEKLIGYKLNIKKVIRYIEEQKTDLSDFLDHIDLMKKLGTPLKKSNMYPKEFWKVHQEEIEEDILRNGTVSEKTNKEFLKTYTKWKKIIKKHKVITQSENYQIFFPESAADIKAEGRLQQHCVGNYIDGAAKGRNLIFYVRVEEGKRLYTAEYTKRKLIQIRAKSNAKATPEAEKLAKQFAKELAEAEAKEEEVKKNKKKQIAV